MKIVLGALTIELTRNKENKEKQKKYLGTCQHDLAEFGEYDGIMVYDWFCKHCKKWEWEWKYNVKH